MRRRMTMRVVAGFIGVLSFIGIVWTEPAWAHVTYVSGRVFASGYDCVNGYDELSHGSYGWGYRRADVTSYYTPGGPYGTNCDSAFNRPPQYMYVRADIVKWTGSSWLMCIQGANHYNTTTTYRYSWSQSQTSSNMCGSGNYAGNGYSFMYNGSWKGGGLYVQQFHWLPA